jgi:cytidylate kinase
MRYTWNGCRGGIEYGGELLGYQLAHPEIANLTAKLASDPKYFTCMVGITEKVISSFPEAIVDGRSAGTVLLPHAEAKFYVDAPISVRAARRLADLAEVHPRLTHDDMLSQLEERDRKDRTRALDPLRIPQGAALIDSSAMSISEAVTYMHQIVQARTGCF